MQTRNFSKRVAIWGVRIQHVPKHCRRPCSVGMEQRRSDVPGREAEKADVKDSTDAPKDEDAKLNADDKNSSPAKDGEAAKEAADPATKDKKEEAGEG